MASLILLWQNRADEATLTTPTPWQIPIEMLQTRILSEVARTVGVDPAETQFKAVLPKRRAIRALVLANNNLTTRARYRVTGARNADGTGVQYDSGWRDVYRRVYSWRELRWGSPNFWFGRPSEEDLIGFTRSLIHVLPETVDAEYWTLELDDQSNPDEYIEIGRLFLAGGSQPSRNYSHGSGLGYETSTRISRSRSGVKFFDRREPFRVMRFNLDLLPDQEVLERWLEIQRRMGLDGEVFVIPDPDDDKNMTRRAFLGTLRALTTWDQLWDDLSSIAFEIEEIL